ncbi:thioesterase II family protein [Chania multitudinisentens]|uniref:thioesterase II family protein n=1 Tax=Chania multitudinisentens TaxID=1639108 RepID=UPI0003E12D9F|nr:alpha/beta fold hydrolase [Chania multitudinisentens]
MKKITLFVLPYAGGSAYAIYNKWAMLLGERICLFPLEYAGHGMRMAEPFHQSIDEVVKDLMLKISKAIATGTPYALYAHSMGCIVAYELLRAIDAAKLPAPLTVFLSGRKPPDYHEATQYHALSDAEFLAKIKKIGGTPQEFFVMEELVKTFLPILRSDYSLIERYCLLMPICPTTSDIVYFFGEDDALVTLEEAQAWRHYTKGHFAQHHYPGGHFFIHQHYPDICSRIGQKLLG